MENKEIERLVKAAEKEAKRAEEAARKAALKAEREARKAAKDAEKLAKKERPQKSEAELVRQYAKIIMDKQTTRGMLKHEFSDLQNKRPTLRIWQDSDFFFSVVFESKVQKYQFLDFLMTKFGITSENEDALNVQIINGLKLAESMGLTLQKEVANDYQQANLELRDFILDV